MSPACCLLCKPEHWSIESLALWVYLYLNGTVLTFYTASGMTVAA